MTIYRMVVIKSGLHWQYHDIPASDDETAKGLAQQRFDELAAELRAQQHPEIVDPVLERFVLYDDRRVVCEVRNPDWYRAEAERLRRMPGDPGLRERYLRLAEAYEDLARTLGPRN